MRILIASLLLSCVAIGANPGVSLAAGNPTRSATAAQNHLMKRLGPEGGVAYCVARRFTNGNSTRGTSFACVLTNFATNTSAAYNVSTRPHGGWVVRRLA